MCIMTSPVGNGKKNSDWHPWLLIITILSWEKSFGPGKIGHSQDRMSWNIWLAFGKSDGTIAQGSRMRWIAIWNEWWEGWEFGTYPINSGMSTGSFTFTFLSIGHKYKTTSSFTLYICLHRIVKDAAVNGTLWGLVITVTDDRKCRSVFLSCPSVSVEKKKRRMQWKD